jgi:hypothetical protein
VHGPSNPSQQTRLFFESVSPPPSQNQAARSFIGPRADGTGHTMPRCALHTQECLTLGGATREPFVTGLRRPSRRSGSTAGRLAQPRTRFTQQQAQFTQQRTRFTQQRRCPEARCMPLRRAPSPPPQSRWSVAVRSTGRPDAGVPQRGACRYEGRGAPLPKFAADGPSFPSNRDRQVFGGGKKIN